MSFIEPENVSNRRWLQDPAIYELAQPYTRTSFIDLNHANVIYEEPATSTAIGTSGLWSCTATIVMCLLPDSRRGTALSHYDPEITTFSKQGLDEPFRRILIPLAEQSICTQAVIVSPGRQDESSLTGFSPQKDSTFVIANLKEIFGKDLPVTQVGYSTDQNRRKFEGTVLAGYSARPNQEYKLLIGGRDVIGGISCR